MTQKTAVVHPVATTLPPLAAGKS